MRRFKPSPKEYERCLPKKERKRRQRRRKNMTPDQVADLRQKSLDSYYKKKLKHSGLWDESCVTSKLTITRISPPSKETELIDTAANAAHINTRTKE